MIAWRRSGMDDPDRLSLWNLHLQEDEGAEVMAFVAIRERMRRWLAGVCHSVVFTESGRDVGYAIYRATDPDPQGEGGVYLRRFFVDRTCRGRGVGRGMIRLFTEEIIRGRSILLKAYESNPGGQAFWRALGFEPYYVGFQRRAIAYCARRVDGDGS
jgi:GNAT superfamily N-acetyltransferase|tara:strand:- start:119 stop:589 length:471 start_codon:yes stop_codon:yes gene_type:complete